MTAHASISIKPGDRFGEWTVQSTYSDNGIMAQCRCSCGQIGPVPASRLLQGRSKRCRNCGNQRNGEINSLAPEFRGHPGYRRNRDRITSILSRCNDPLNKAYPDYGGRGIRVWAAWKEDHTQFFRCLALLPGWDDPALEIDRINNDLGYEPGNLRFVTHAQNNRNTRRNRPDATGTQDHCQWCGNVFIRTHSGQPCCSISCGLSLSWEKRRGS
jgi:hypothetical protein